MEHLSITFESKQLFDTDFENLILFLLNMPTSWVCAYFAQLNPLIGPEILPEQLAAAAREWGKKNV